MKGKRDVQAGVSLIWAQDEAGLIGRDGGLPWCLPADLAWFRKQTMGKPVLMGRATFESIGRPLPGRTNIVLTHRQDFRAEGCTVVHSVEEAREAAGDAEEIMVIGGAGVYTQLLPHATRLYVTRIHARFDGDTWFPALDYSTWREVFCEKHAPDDRNPYTYSFHIYSR